MPSGEKKVVNLEGKIFGRLTAIKPTSERYFGSIVWECKCSCGNPVHVEAASLVSGNTKSCGCMHTESANLRWAKNKNDNVHGYIDNTCISQIRSKEIRSDNTTGITGVCYNKKDRGYKKYRARITFKRKCYDLGRYITLEEAIEARKRGEEMIFGPFLEWYYETFPDKKPKISA